MPQTTVSESIEIAVPPHVVYEAVTNVADMGRWSPECTGADIKGSPGDIRVGMRFTGRNESEKSRPWSTACTVTTADAGERFAFAVRASGMAISTWSYVFEPTGGGATRVTENWTDQRGRFLQFISPFVTGIKDREAHNRQNMKVTLQRLKETLEREHQAA
jgi:uncharacterized protein YndB with AHSA1/START domain